MMTLNRDGKLKVKRRSRGEGVEGGMPSTEKAENMHLKT